MKPTPIETEAQHAIEAAEHDVISYAMDLTEKDEYGGWSRTIFPTRVTVSLSRFTRLLCAVNDLIERRDALAEIRRIKQIAREAR